MTTLHQPREAGFTPLFAERGPSGAARSSPRVPPLRLVVLGETLAGDVALVAGSRARLTLAETRSGGTSLRALASAVAAIVCADLVLVADEADGHLLRIAARMKSPHRIARVGAREGAHEAARTSYFTAIADALTRVDREGAFSYADRAKLSAAGHAPEMR